MIHHLLSQKKTELQTVNLHCVYLTVEDLAYLGYRIDTYVKKTEKFHSKNAHKMVQELTDLKKRLVITTGDRYVQEADEELREKLSKLYNEVAESYDKPAPVQFKNIEVYESQIQDAWIDYRAIEKKQLQKVTKELQNAGINLIEIKTKEQFLVEL